MEIDNALQAIENGMGALATLGVTYTFSVIGAILLVIIGYVAAGLIERTIRAGLAKVPGFDATLRTFFAMIARYVVLLLVLVMVLGQFGVQTASIIAAMGAIGLAIGLALQGTLQNIAAGIMLLALRPFRIGEYVEVDTVAGTIEEIGLFATRLRALDGIYILAPNSTLWNQPVRNFSRNNARRNDIVVGIGYDDDIDLAQDVLVGLARAESRVNQEPAPVAFVSALGDSAVSVTLRYWTNASDFLGAKIALTKLAKTTFDDRGISIPFPQQEVIYREPPKGISRQ